MSRTDAPAAPERIARPGPVVALVALTWLSAFAAIAASALAIVALAAITDPADATGDDRATLMAAAIVTGAAAAALVALAIALWRGSNTARVLLTAVLAFRIVQDLYVASSGGNWAAAAPSIVGAALNLALAWSPRANAWFQPERERQLADALGLERRTVRWRLKRATELAVQALVVWATIGLTPGISADGWAAALGAAVSVAIVTWLLRPLWLKVASRFGWAGALVAALLGNAVTVGVALWIAPGVDVSSPGWALIASWIFAALMTLVTWLFTASSYDYLLVHAARMSLDDAAQPADDAEGVLFIQLDGVSAPLLEQEIRAGNLPTITRWLRSGTHARTEWTAGIPSTTPASQSGILQGSAEGIPCFRWWDRELGRFMAANQPNDAADIEARTSSGFGLLADDGVSISNLFSGDAARSYLTVSGLRSGDRQVGASRSYAHFFTHPAGLARAVPRTIGEMLKEVWQARRQEWRGVEPRVHRGADYVALRGVTNVLLRDLNVALVIEAMMDGAKSIYVDFVDYDEIAHHAGVTRPESLASLYGLDTVLRTFEQFIARGIAPRDYRIVLVSDHGQSQGATFLQRYGISLEDFVRERTGGRAVTAPRDEAEDGGPARLLVRQLAEQDSVTGRVARRAMRRRDDAGGEQDSRVASGDGPGLAVVGSGNLGGIWFTDSPTRLTLADLEEQHPGLIESLATHPGVAFVVVQAGTGPVAIGPRGLHRLATGEVEGEDPLEGFGPHARRDFLHVSHFPSAPDIYLNSAYDASLDEVMAFEELVGCHGGLGGWQTRALLVHPADWSVDADLVAEDGHLHTAENLHRQLVRWLEGLGHRAGMPSDAERHGAAAVEEPAESP
ncbi:alkaline phosphatase family protein [Demequina sp. SYSU T00039]|uniref:Alkaline phosphatase family protein n=1 Tax=Demequina lignilytica TaxID=3051663 RepID=A0AAW7M8I3_9MICO|nr:MULTISPECIES: alkaline phosphatase family protein [unclassified Demequina]MDN4477911.1 alkaline phosphatase family protein [Demequina sp. SYSU T00039-1]MDN4487820.1 alkaline phosphatase family protein [Demequina sp. SYSU T00039]